MRKLLILTLLLMLIYGTLIPQSKNNLPPVVDIEVFFGDPEISGAKLSPDGKFISFRKPYNGVMNIWVKNIDEPFDNAKPLTADTKRPLTAYFWSRDGKYILFAQDNGGDENYRIYAVNPLDPADASTGVPKPKDLTPIEKVRVMIFNVPKDDPVNIIIGINDRDPKYHDLYKLNINTGVRSLIIKNEFEVASWIVDEKGNVRGAYRQTEDGGTELLKLTDGKLARIFYVTNEEEVGFEAFTEDDNYAYISTNKGNDVDLSRLMKLNFNTGETEFIEEDPEKEVDFAGIFISDVTNKPIATIYIGDKTRYYFIDKEWESVIKDAISKMPEGDWRITSATKDETKLLFSISSDVDPGSVYFYDRNTREAKLLYKSRPNLPSEYLSEMKPVKYTARDGIKIPAYVVLPKGIEGKNLPAVIFPHGGPWARDYWGYNPLAQFLANRGYAVLIPNFRGSTGYGKKFLNLGNKEWGTGTMQHDLTDGVKFMIDNGYANPEKVAIMGGSYGGYATLAGLAFTPDIYAAGVNIVGPSNIITLLKTIPPYWAPIKKMFDVRLGDLNNPEDVERMKKQSPLFYASNIKAPLLVIQGANDPRVKQAESDRIVVTLRELNRQVEYLLAEDEGHGFAGKLNRLAMVGRIDKFLEKHLNGRSQESYSDEVQQRLEKLTVDINTVVLPDDTGGDLENAKKSSLPVFNKLLVKEYNANYEMSTNLMGQVLNFTLKKELKKSEEGDNYELTDDMITPMGEIKTKTFFNTDNLLPVSQMTKQGNEEIFKIYYKKDRITGKVKGAKEIRDIDYAVDKPVIASGAYLEFVLGVIPLSEGYSTYLPVYDVTANEIQYSKVNVLNIEDVSVKAGTFRCYKIKVTDLENNSTNYYWINADDRPVLIKSETKLPVQMGGSILTTEYTGND
ncbi:MAG: alpha/beta fold hydrolase [Ignavibacteria bacterium]|nr:alpha/beta fold hydrolase [Ignavibacteria bacterium]